MPNHDDRPHWPDRVSPGDSAEDVLERLVGRRQLQSLQMGDVVLIRESLPTLKPAATARARYRVVIHPEREGPVFDSFQNAAAEGEALANKRRARLVYVEHGTASILSDYHRTA